MPNPPKLAPHRGTRGRGITTLPAAGRQGKPPAWPLGAQNTSEREAWSQLWATPQAAAWERLGWTRTIARYCRVMVLAEDRDATAAMLAQACALEDRLGLTPKSMRLLLWQIAADELAGARAPRRDERPRLRAVE